MNPTRLHKVALYFFIFALLISTYSIVLLDTDLISKTLSKIANSLKFFFIKTGQNKLVKLQYNKFDVSNISSILFSELWWLTKKVIYNLLRKQLFKNEKKKMY